MSTAEKWENIKLITKDVAQKCSRRKAFTFKKAEKLLQRKRVSILRTIQLHPDLINELSPQLNVVESQQSQLQAYHSETLAIRAGLKWRELGELSAGYLKEQSNKGPDDSLYPLCFILSLVC